MVLQTLFLGLFTAIAGGLFVLSLAPWVNKRFFAAEIASSFPVVYLFGAFVLAVFILFFAQGFYKVLPLLGLVIVMNALALWPCVAFFQKPASSEGTLKVLQANLYLHNKDPKAFLDLVAQENPDIIVLAEVTSAWLSTLQDLKQIYPHQLVEVPDNYAYGIAALARTDVVSMQRKSLTKGPRSALFLKIQHQGQSIDFIALHASNPLTTYGRQQQEFDAFIDWWRDNNPQNAIVAGDFNATLWSPGLRHVMRATGLIHARLKRGYKGTWHQALPPFARLPIDHVLVAGVVEVSGFALGPDIGSDHLPTLTTLAIKKTK